MLDASRANMVESFVALELQMAEGCTAQTQQELLVKYQSQNETLQKQLQQSAVTHQAKQAEVKSTISALHQTMSGLRKPVSSKSACLRLRPLSS